MLNRKGSILKPLFYLSHSTKATSSGRTTIYDLSCGYNIEGIKNTLRKNLV